MDILPAGRDRYPSRRHRRLDVLNMLVGVLAISGGPTVPVTLALACVAGYLVYRRRSAAGA